MRRAWLGGPHLHVQRVLVGGGVDGDGVQAHLLAGADHTHRDLTTIGNQHLLEAGLNLRGIAAAAVGGGDRAHGAGERVALSSAKGALVRLAVKGLQSHGAHRCKSRRLDSRTHLSCPVPSTEQGSLIALLPTNQHA